MNRLTQHINSALRTHDGLSNDDIDYAREIIISYSLPYVARILTYTDKRGYIARISYIYNDIMDELIKKRSDGELKSALEDAYYPNMIMNIDLITESEENKLICIIKNSIMLHETILCDIVGKNSPEKNVSDLCLEEKYMSKVIINMPEYVWINVKTKYYNQVYKIKESDLVKSLAKDSMNPCTGETFPHGVCFSLREKYSINIKFFNEAYA